MILGGHMKKLIVVLGCLSLAAHGMQHIKKNFPKTKKITPLIFNANKGLLYPNSYHTNNFEKWSIKSNTFKVNPINNTQLPIKIRFYTTNNSLGDKKLSEKTLISDIDPKWKKLILENFYALKQKYGTADIKKLLNSQSPNVKQYSDEYFIAFEKKFRQESKKRLNKLKVYIEEHIENEQIRNNTLTYLIKMDTYHTKEIIKDIHSTWNAVKEKRAPITIKQKAIDQVPIKNMDEQSTESIALPKKINTQQKSVQSWLSKIGSSIKDFFTSVSKINESTEVKQKSNDTFDNE